jgi:hypothetical protein
MLADLLGWFGPNNPALRRHWLDRFHAASAAN